METEKKPSVREAEQYVKSLIETQSSLGYRSPKSRVVKAAVGDAAQAVQALTALSARKG